MSARVDIVTGLPASGKSHFVSVLNSEKGRRSFTDWHGWNPVPENEKYRQWIRDILNEGKGCIIESSRFTTREYLDNVLSLVDEYSVQIYLTMFRNQPLACFRNAFNDSKRLGQSRVKHARRVRDILKFYERYDPYRGISHVDVEQLCLSNVYAPSQSDPSFFVEYPFDDPRVDIVKGIFQFGEDGTLAKDADLEDRKESGCAELMRKVGEVIYPEG